MDRRQRIIASLRRRQVDLELLLDDVHSSQNISAILRSADAVGILRLFYSRRGDEVPKFHKTITQGAHRWIRKRRILYAERLNFVRSRREEGMQVVAAHLDGEARHFREIDYTRPTLLVLGNEAEGVSDELLELVDHRVRIPMEGMVQSLNVSAAAAVILYEAQRQREEAGCYERPGLSEEEIEAIAERLLYRDLVARRSKGRIPATDRLWLQW